MLPGGKLVPMFFPFVASMLWAFESKRRWVVNSSEYL